MEVVVVRQEPSAPGGETTAVRLLGLLPADWICVPDDVGTDRVRLRIEYGHGGHGVGDSDGVHGALAEVLADTALRGWSAEPS
ncbi:hypothetical protein DVA86_03140 [Streptomyces armeniacus]|uniref:Uncharacterized protein n=1 Tax=Streptomyces armeniacus TaxID=83291 RepID=A0A345XZI3_9ACTN|nr:hypothetical protein [Streptomyces armeniacus]AXK37049.1 hypothetical protein DVA86_03140 [Streptomyces armeniacus]